MIRHCQKINDKYFESGINNEGLQFLADKTKIILCVMDYTGTVWHEFVPKCKGNHQKLLLCAHNNHIDVEGHFHRDMIGIKLEKDSILVSPNTENPISVSTDMEIESGKPDSKEEKENFESLERGTKSLESGKPDSKNLASETSDTRIIW